MKPESKVIAKPNLEQLLLVLELHTFENKLISFSSLQKQAKESKAKGDDENLNGKKIEKKTDSEIMKIVYLP